MKDYRVSVYDAAGNVVARVRYNANLDYWNGREWTNGGVGSHKGLTKLEDGRYVLIHGTQWQGQKDYGEVITAWQALQEILRSGNIELLETKKFGKLNELYDEMMDEIDDPTDEEV